MMKGMSIHQTYQLDENLFNPIQPDVLGLYLWVGLEFYFEPQVEFDSFFFFWHPFDQTQPDIIYKNFFFITSNIIFQFD